MLENEQTSVIQEEIGRLPEKYRAAVVLCNLEGLTHEMAAERLGLKPSC
jgi:DNA-directed RNA polymerase specialized sigma24 family protein